MVERRFEAKISVNIPEWMANWLRKKAMEEGLTTSDIVRKAIREYIRKHGEADKL